MSDETKQTVPQPNGCDPATGSLSSEQLHVLQHSLGVDKYGDGIQYRNHFVTGLESADGKLCRELVGMGLMKDHGPQAMSGGMRCYTVTARGIDAMVLQSPARPKLTRSKKRYQKYLRSETSLTFSEWIGAKK